MTIEGAVIRRDMDDRRELPISDVVVTASDGVIGVNTQTDASGYFKMIFPESLWSNETVGISFRHPDYQPVDLQLRAGLRLSANKLQVAAMEPRPLQPDATVDHPPAVVSNVRIRYTLNSQAEQNIGSAVKTFQVVNRGNLPCDTQSKCSPDGEWKASTGSIVLDAGSDNEFRNVRVSCIAGPCPFTRIDSSGFASNARSIKASALDWSDTATFLLEAEVFRVSISSNLRGSYPVIFGKSLNFTLPPTQEGVSIEAEINGVAMVFPLGPNLFLSWATCIDRNNKEENNSTVYRCELKPGYRF